MTPRVLILITMLMVAFDTAAGAQTESTNERLAARLDRVIRVEMKKDGISGLAAAIVRDGELIWSGTYGVRDVDTQAPVTADTTFMLGSISKTVAAVAIMQLVDQGRVDLDTDVNEYLPFSVRHPKFPDTPITVRMLMTHRAGLVNPKADFPAFNQTWPGDTAPSIYPWIEQFFDPEKPEQQRRFWQSRPDTKNSSSNMGVTLLGAIVEVVSGVDFCEYCRVNIFEPLGMNNSGLRAADVEAAHAATLYQRGREVEPFSFPTTPTGSARSSINDLAHYVNAMLQGGVHDNVRILSEAAVDEMLTIVYPDANLALGAGVGLIWRSYGPRDEWIGHTGAITGASTCLDFHREANIGVIALAAGRGQRTVYPGGNIYAALHREASKLAENRETAGPLYPSHSRRTQLRW